MIIFNNDFMNTCDSLSTYGGQPKVHDIVRPLMFVLVGLYVIQLII